MKKIFCFNLIIVILLLGFVNIRTAYAANLRFYNYNSKSNENYSGKQVTYVFNERELFLEKPGIIISGTALADYYDVFVKELGLEATRTDNVITITDGVTTLKLTLGSKKVQINNKTQTMSVAPVKLKFDDETVKYYVPTRFVAETFGFGYIYNSATSTVNLIKTYQFSIDNKTFLYDGTLYSVLYNKQYIKLSFPIVFYEDSVLAPAKELFEALNCFYEETDTSIIISKDNISVSMNYTEENALVNELSFSMEHSPEKIINLKSGDTAWFVSLEFVTSMLGYEISYNEVEKSYSINTTEYTGTPEKHPELEEYYRLKQEKEQALQQRRYYFEWEKEESNQEAVAPGTKEVTKIAAYSIEHADVLEIYGICRDDIVDFIDNMTVVFEIKDTVSFIGTKFFVDFETPHLNYVFLKTINNTKMLFMIPIEDTWYFVEQKDCLQVYFMNAEQTLDDLTIAWEPEEMISNEEPAIVYPKDKLIIPLPENVTQASVRDKDNYLNKNFVIQIEGLYVEFYEQNKIINPYSFVNNITIEYDPVANYTNITCHTKEIYGYNINQEDKFLEITVDEPSLIYDKIVVLDAGHGGKDPGAIKNNVYEKTLNYNILCVKAKCLFEQSDIKVYYTRETDKYIDLSTRAKFAAKVEADLFISLHMNSSEQATATGTEVFYSSANNQKNDSGLNSYRMGNILVDNLCASMGTKRRGTTKSDYYVVKYNAVPAVLIELGFISNEEECKKLSDEIYQEQAAQAIYQSVLEIFSTYPTGR